MSLLLDTNARYVQFNAAAIDQLDAMTLVCVYRAASVSGGPFTLLSKDFDGSNAQFNAFRPQLTPGPDDWAFFHRRATTNTFVRSGGNIIQANRWEWVAFLDSDGTAPRIFHGPLTARPVEPTYNLQITGAGAPPDDSATNMHLGRDVLSGTQTINARIAFLGIANRRMADAEVLTHWPKPRIAPGAGWILFAYPALHGPATTVDLSGRAVNGTVNGTPAQAANPPWPAPLLME